MSNISTDSINGNYPIAGQDNSSQGFRDNFTAIKNNLATVKTEIEEIQNNGVFKTALTGITLNNDFNYVQVKDIQAIGFADRIVALGTVSGSVSVDFSAGHVHTATSSGTITLAFTNIPTSAGFNMLGRVKLIITVANVAHILKLPAVVNVGRISSTHIAAGTGGDTGLNLITFPAVGVYILDFSIVNTSPATIYLENVSLIENQFSSIRIAGRTIIDSVQTITEGDVDVTVSTSTHATLFVSTGAGPGAWATPAALGAGSEGQIKVLAYKTDTGATAKVTVTNGAWGSNPVKFVTFDDAGDTVTLQYLDGKWYCLSNNGSTLGSE